MDTQPRLIDVGQLMKRRDACLSNKCHGLVFCYLTLLWCLSLFDSPPPTLKGVSYFLASFTCISDGVPL